MENKSHLTAISRKTISAPMVVLSCELDGTDALDYGCGKGFDADEFDMDKYDLYFFPEKPEGKKYEVVTCNYVLCVVEEDEQQAVIDEVMSFVEPGGYAYFTVRRDKKNLNGWTKRDTFQRYVELDEDIYYEAKGRYCIYKIKQTEGLTKKTFVFKLKIRDEENVEQHEFKEGIGVGVLITQEVTFNMTPREVKLDPDGVRAVYAYQQELLNKWAEVIFEEVHHNDVEK